MQKTTRGFSVFSIPYFYLQNGTSERARREASSKEWSRPGKGVKEEWHARPRTVLSSPILFLEIFRAHILDQHA